MEFFSKLSITEEEVDETETWLDLHIESRIYDDDFIRKLHIERFEVCKNTCKHEDEN